MEPKMKLTVTDKVMVPDKMMAPDMIVPEVVLTPVSMVSVAPIQTVTVSTAFVNRNPSSWFISEENDIITAKNNDSSEVFVGTIEEFNIKLRG
jgi:hypothetical protein